MNFICFGLVVWFLSGIVFADPVAADGPLLTQPQDASVSSVVPPASSPEAPATATGAENTAAPTPTSSLEIGAPKKEPLPQDPGLEPKDEGNLIRIGDLLSVTIKEDRLGPQVMLVDEQGNLNLSYVGPVMAKGLTCKQLEVLMKNKLEATYYKQATVTVRPASQEGIRGQIQVTGQVAMPGSIKLPSDEVLTASRAILRAGPTPSADLTRVTIVRKDLKELNKDVRIAVNISDVINNGRFEQDIIVKANDMIFVPGKGESIGQILMSGAIRQPGPLDIPIGAKFNLTDAIFRAGGFAEFADKEKVKIVRKDPAEKDGQKTIVVNVEAIMDQGKLNLDQPLQNDDVVIVPEKWFNF
jgi:protein involved in polysaccharide export with SLBB domain